MSNQILHVQKYLRSGKTLKDLQEEHGVYANEKNGKVGLNYNQIEATNSDPLSQQCRGLILRKDTWDIVACPLYRFFNLEQKDVAANIDWSSASYFDKKDGTLCIVYFDHVLEQWFIGTRGRCEADADAHDSGMTFSHLVDETVNKMKFSAGHIVSGEASLQNLMSTCPKDKTYVFELTTPLNRIVCYYEEFKLTLLMVRDNNSLQELDPDDFLDLLSFYGVKAPEIFEFKNINDMIQAVHSWSPKTHEGVVVRDKNFNRVKAKSPQYVAFNKLNCSLSTSWKGITEVILMKQDDDVISMVPDFIGNRINRLKPLIKEVLRLTQHDYDELCGIEDMKEFALIAQKKLWPGALFALKRNKTPDLMTFAIGNNPDQMKISSNSCQTMLDLCEKIDPNFKDDNH